MKNNTLAALALMIAAMAGLSVCAAAPPKHLLTPAGHLTPCPSSPNCVSSEEPPSDNHYVAPLQYRVSRARAYHALLAVLQHMRRTRIVTKQSDYIHATVRSAVFGFVDDVTFQFHPNDKRIDMKSASRLGYYDFGVNGRRAAMIRRRFNARLKKAPGTG